MKVVFDFSLDAWIKGVEIEANSYEEALAKLHQMEFNELMELGYAKDFTIDKVDGVVTERTVTVKVYDIEYDVEEDDYENPEDYIQFINSLPTTLKLNLTVEPNDDIEDLIADEILYETNQTVNNFRFMILEEN